MKMPLSSTPIAIDRCRASSIWCAWKLCVVLLVAATVLAGCASQSNTDQRSQEQAERTDAFTLALAATDHEALFTLVGGLKPMSTGIWRGSFDVDEPDLHEMRQVRAALDLFRTDVWYADVQVFDKIHDGERSVHAFVVHRKAMARMIERYEVFWSPWGITPSTHPAEIVAVVDRMPKADRWRGYGYLFGYPPDAVDFFVEAGLEEDREVGPGKDRRFVQIPTYAAETGRFTYAVPLGHMPTAGDEALEAEAERILVAYTEHRPRLRDARDLVSALRDLNRRFEPAAAAAARMRDTQDFERGAEDAVLDAR